jgi:hypothetical protein
MEKHWPFCSLAGEQSPRGDPVPMKKIVPGLVQLGIKPLYPVDRPSEPL